MHSIIDMTKAVDSTKGASQDLEFWSSKYGQKHFSADGRPVSHDSHLVISKDAIVTLGV